MTIEEKVKAYDEVLAEPELKIPNWVYGKRE